MKKGKKKPKKRTKSRRLALKLGAASVVLLSVWGLCAEWFVHHPRAWVAEQTSAHRVLSAPLESYSGNCYLGIDAGSTTTKLALIGSALSNGFADEKTALALVQTALDALKTQLGGVDDNLLKAINNVSTAFGSLLTSGTVDMATALANILSAIQGQPDYAATLAAIQQAIAALVALQA